jgi:formamidopyrimidine-DNA glycosylase
MRTQRASVPAVPELPEVETVRRMLEKSVVGLRVHSIRRSRMPLRMARPDSKLVQRLREQEIRGIRRHGKYLIFDFSGGWSLLSHLGMSGRWLFVGSKLPALDHVHARIRFDDGSELWFQDPRRFGLFHSVRTSSLGQDPALAVLGPDPILSPQTGAGLHEMGQNSRVPIKSFLMDQSRIAGVGNIYASEILHRARIHPARSSSSLSRTEWDAVAREILTVLIEAIDRMGTTFSSYRTLWNEPGSFGDQLRVYERVGEPCRKCGATVRRIVQSNRSTFYCPRCQPRSPAITRAKLRRQAQLRG